MNNASPANATALPTRRLFLTSGSVATVLGAMPAAAHAAEPSELLGLIATYKAANEAFCAAVDIQEHAEDRYGELRDEASFMDRVTPAGPGCVIELRFGYDECKRRIAEEFEIQRGRMKGLVGLSPSLGEQALALIDAKEAEHLAALDENYASFEERINARKEACGLAAAEQLWQETNETDEAAALALLSYKCRDLEEARIKAEYILSSPLVDDMMDGGFVEAFLGSFLA